MQREENTGCLFVQVHTGSRGFGHGLATNYFELAREEKPHEITDLDLGYFTPESAHYRAYLNAVNKALYAKARRGSINPKDEVSVASPLPEEK